MKGFKKVDLIVQFALMVAGFVIWLSMLPKDFGAPLPGYFMVGGWQVLSMVVHWIARYDMRWWSARSVHTVILLLLAVIVACLGLMGLFGLYYAAPLLAVWYWLICYVEWRRLRVIPQWPSTR
jgi:hypothetical protein